MTEYTVPAKTLTLWQLRATALWLFLSIICGYYSFKIKYLLIAVTVLTVLFILIIFWYLPKLFSLFKIRFINESVVLEVGVIFRNTHILPFSRLIYCQTTVSPLARVFGLAAVSLKAARSLLIIPEMKKEDAEKLVRRIEGKKR